MPGLFGLCGCIEGQIRKLGKEDLITPQNSITPDKETGLMTNQEFMTNDKQCSRCSLPYSFARYIACALDYLCD